MSYMEGFSLPVQRLVLLCGTKRPRLLLVLSIQGVAMLARIPVWKTVSTQALQVLLGVVPLDLEMIRRAVTFRIKKGLLLLDHDWVSAKDLENLKRKKINVLLDECLVSRWRTRLTNANVVRRRPNFGFGMSLGFLLTGRGSLNVFLHKETCLYGMWVWDGRRDC